MYVSVLVYEVIFLVGDEEFVYNYFYFIVKEVVEIVKIVLVECFILFYISLCY